MALPKQVQRQADAITEYDRQQAEAIEGATAQPPEDPEAPPAQPAPSSVVAMPSPAPATAQPADAQWEQKYRTLQGMFSQETRNLHNQIRTLSDELTALRDQVKQRDTPPAPPTTLITEKDTEAFGADLVDMARRVAREEFGTRESSYLGRIAQLEEQVTQQVGAVQQNQQQSSREGFFAKLESVVPGWEQMQVTEACQQWLASRIPGAGFTWNDVLVDAAEKFDAARAIEVFQTFRAAHAPQPPQRATPNPAAQRRAELSRQVTPPRVASSPAQLPGERRIYSAAEYESETLRAIRLNKTGKYDEATQIETDLNAALMEGRIRP